MTLCVQGHNREVQTTVQVRTNNPITPSRPAFVPRESTPRQLSVPAQPTYTPMEVDAVRQRRGPLTREEKEYRRINNLCAYCGRAGHGVENCRATPKSNDRQQPSRVHAVNVMPDEEDTSVTVLTVTILAAMSADGGVLLSACYKLKIIASRNHLDLAQEPSNEYLEPEVANICQPATKKEKAVTTSLELAKNGESQAQ
nr:hypothetical protein L203_00942 [Cryptococcus depauperatus CBS 7841]